MNISNEERFHELAHKALTKEATPAEQRELRALIAEKPKLKENLEQISGEVAVAREILPLLEDLQHPQGNIPQPPMERLQKEVREVFAASAKSTGDLRELLKGLENWAGRQAGTGREEVMALVALLRGSLLTRGSEAIVAEPAMLRTAHFAQAAPRLMEEAEARVKAEETRRQQAELEKRLRSLETRIRQAEEITHECRDEARALLESFAREQASGAERRGQNPNPLTKH